MKQEELENYRKAGKIASQVKEYAKSIIKKNMLLIDIAEKIEAKIKELKGFPAFPVNLSINDIAAHCTPTSDDTTKAFGLLKIDLGVSVNGYIVDTAFSLDLENNEENKKLIEASEKALEKACKITKPNIEVWKIGQEIHKTITSYNFAPIRNLSGHSLEKYKVHAGLTIPNYNNNNTTKLVPGVYAIEPFATTGEGIVYEGKPSWVYKFEKRVGVRDKSARKILQHIEEEYKTLPFCERQISRKFPNSRIALKFLENCQAIKQYAQLVEKSHKKVSQAETTILVTDKIEILV